MPRVYSTDPHTVYIRQWRAKKLKEDPLYFKRYKDARKQYDKDRHIQTKFGLSPEQYDELWEHQGGRCAICAKELKDPVIDHNHETGQVRGLLCRTCNTGIGMLQDSVRLLTDAISYLESH